MLETFCEADELDIFNAVFPGDEEVGINDLAAARIRAAEKKAQIRIRRSRMTLPPAVAKEAADAAARKDLAKALSQSIRELYAREEIPAILNSIQDAARINVGTVSGRPVPASVVFADGSRVERRRGKAEIRSALREHFDNMVADAEELNSCFDDDYYDEYFDLHEDEILASPDGYPDEGPCEFYESGRYVGF